MTAYARLDASLLVSRDHEVLGAQGFAAPAALIEVEHPPGFVRELGIAEQEH